MWEQSGLLLAPTLILTRTSMPNLVVRLSSTQISRIQPTFPFRHQTYPAVEATTSIVPGIII